MPEKDYSHRDVTDKLGLKPDQAVLVVGVGTEELLMKVRAKIGRGFAATGPADVILYWPKGAAEITATLKRLRGEIVPNGGVWVVTPKRDHPGYIQQEEIIPLGLAAGLVDNKTCSISDDESAMRFVIRKKDRPRRGWATMIP